MHKNSVPQDNSETYAGLRKLMYAVDERGEYTEVPSTGWEVEAYATLAAVGEIDRLRDDAWRRARNRETSPLEYHMYRKRMEPATLAATTGIWKWRIRRHFDPKRFASLPDAVLARYAEVLGMQIVELRELPEQPHG
jgi:hypothetical protein